MILPELEVDPWGCLVVPAEEGDAVKSLVLECEVFVEDDVSADVNCDNWEPFEVLVIAVKHIDDDDDVIHDKAFWSLNSLQSFLL